MQALEQELFASGLPVEALMEKAGLALAGRILALGRRPPEAPAAAPGETELGEALRRGGALVLVGPGHNGGDGLVIARELHLEGVPVRIWCPFERRKPLTEAHWRHALWLGIPVLAGEPEPDDDALWIDALFGNGQRRPPGEAIEELLRRRQTCRPGRLLAIDIPTGLCGDSGRLLGSSAACSALTLALGLIRQGLVQDTALEWVGRLERIELGLPPRSLAALPAGQPLGVGGPDAGAGSPRPAAPRAAGKYGRGRVLVIAGSHRYPGAALLALSGASASGCGSLRAGLPQPLESRIWSQLPHVVPQEAPLRAATLNRLDAVLVGPGLGPRGSGAWLEGQGGDDQDAWQQLQAFSGPLVLDADGLNRIDADWLTGRAGPTWITPHAGEFGRLFPDLADLPPLEAAPIAAQRCGAGVLLKGARTVVAAADGRRWQLLNSCPATARAGLGDVLAGYAAGLAARAVAAGPPQAAQPDAAVLALAALDHALAGCRTAAARGPGGATPEAVAQELQHAGAGVSNSDPTT